MGSTAYLMWTVLFSSLGLGYFVYGKKQGRPVPLISGVALMCYPYFVSNTYLLAAIGAALSALPFVLKL